MRVVVDATPVGARLKGTGRVLVGLLKAFPRVVPGWDIAAFSGAEGAQVLASSGVRGVDVVVVGIGSGVVWELRGFPRAAAEASADAVITLREVVGFGGPPTVLHVAEPPLLRIAQHGRPSKHQAKDRLIQGLLRGSIDRAAAVTAASPTTATWLKDRYPVDPPVIPPGIDDFFLERIEAGDPEQPYFLHAASGDVRDNTETAFRAFAEARLSGDGIRLILVGTPPSQQEELEELAASLGIGDAVGFEGWVTDARLRELYRDALALVQPSRFEGFAGLQPLEAMAQGTAVVVQDAPGVTEALGPVAEVVPQDRPDLLAAALGRLATDEVHRSHLGEAGRALAQGFTWERAASAFVEVLKGISDR